MVDVVAPVVPHEGKFTVEEALEHIGFGRTQAIMFLFVGIAWAGDGMEMMLLSYLGPEVRRGTLTHTCNYDTIFRSLSC
jgi:hypothetical protein